MAWRLAKSLDVLRKQINEMAPNRSKSSDGSIGDDAHASRSSDHNPWVKDGEMGVVTAIDITHDPAHGVDARKLAEALVASRDVRIKYLISNREIVSSESVPWKWRPYKGSNPHDKHFHISVRPSRALYDLTTDWTFGPLTPVAGAEQVPMFPQLRRGSTGEDVKKLQGLLNRRFAALTVDGQFGMATEQAVKMFQKQAEIIADGVVGAYTWAALQS